MQAALRVLAALIAPGKLVDALPRRSVSIVSWSTPGILSSVADCAFMSMSGFRGKRFGDHQVRSDSRDPSSLSSPLPTPGESRSRGQPGLPNSGTSGFSKLWTKTVDELAKVHSFPRGQRRQKVAQKRRFPSCPRGSGKRGERQFDTDSMVVWRDLQPARDERMDGWPKLGTSSE